MKSRPVVRSLRALALAALRYLYWRMQAYDGDVLFQKALEGVWWHVRGEAHLREQVARVRPQDRV